MMYVAHLALCTPLGLGASATVRACAAGISRNAAIDDLPGAPVASRLSRLPTHLHREERMLALLQSCLRQIRAVIPALLLPVACFLALPEPGTGVSFHLPRWLDDLRRCEETSQIDLIPAHCFLSGRAGLFAALEAASEHLHAHGGLVIVGGVDCMSDPYSLRILASEKRLLGSGNPDGLVPGEAAGLVVLGDARAIARHRLARLGSLPALARADEAAVGRTPFKAEALTAVLRGLRHHEALAGQRVERILSCQPETQFWAQEFSTAYLRNAELMPEPVDRRGLSRTLGDVGAAAGVVQLAMALDALRPPARWGRCHPLSRLLVYGSSDMGACGAFLVTP